MIGKTRWVDGRMLRCGYTTGSCAAAAAKAAALMLVHREPINTVTIITPNDTPLTLNLLSPQITPGYARCAIQKDAGDDPDVTDGIQVIAEIRYQTTGTLTIETGEGIGRVTRDGIGIPVGHGAISKTPRRMIENELLPLIKPGKGFHLTLSVPGGETVAKKTMNSRLGIVGGISIIGTTGIVEPMSRDAFIKALFIEIDMALKTSPHHITLVFGNYGKQFLDRQPEKTTNPPVIKFGNFLGETLDYLKNKKELTSIRLVGHIGKMIKVAGGIFNTKNSVADARMEIFAAMAAASGASPRTVRGILEAVTTEDALTRLPAPLKEKFVSQCLKRIAGYLRHRLGERITLRLMMFSFESGLMGQYTDLAAETKP
jgi:cobalt-precorrin-5B (C1)-methyltransferase